jgi:hypothetical protein
MFVAVLSVAWKRNRPKPVRDTVAHLTAAELADAWADLAARYQEQLDFNPSTLRILQKARRILQKASSIYDCQDRDTGRASEGADAGDNVQRAA